MSTLYQLAGLVVSAAFASVCCSRSEVREQEERPNAARRASSAGPSVASLCRSEVPAGVELTVRGVPHPFEMIETSGGSIYARVPGLTRPYDWSPPLPLRKSGKHELEPKSEGREIWMKVDGSPPTLVAVDVRSSAPSAAEILPGLGRPPARAADLPLVLDDDEAQTLAALRVQATAYEVPDLRRFGRLSAVELVFAPPLDCAVDDARGTALPDANATRSRGRSCRWPPFSESSNERLSVQHDADQATSRRLADVKTWLQALPETVEYLRLEHVPLEALEVLPLGIEHLELSGVSAASHELSLAAVPGIRAVRTLVVETEWAALSLDGLEDLRALRLDNTWIDVTDLARVERLERFASSSVRLAPLLKHASLREVDLRGAVIHDWTEAAELLRHAALPRLLLVDASVRNGGELTPTPSSPMVSYTAVEELRSVLSCAMRIIVRAHHEHCEGAAKRPQRLLSTLSGMPALAVIRSLAHDARDGIGHQGSCDMPVIDVYQGPTFMLTLTVSEDCRSLGSDLWRKGISLTDNGAGRLCAWLRSLDHGPRP
jgi:hypothetical protein